VRSGRTIGRSCGHMYSVHRVKLLMEDGDLDLRVRSTLCDVSNVCDIHVQIGLRRLYSVLRTDCDSTIASTS
jgi:hypothetical protein